jgi:hypothetical protein
VKRRSKTNLGVSSIQPIDDHINIFGDIPSPTQILYFI